MKKILWLVFCCGNIAVANQMINQQYVQAAPAPQSQLQHPFSHPQNSTPHTQPKSNPDAIYTSPEKNQHVLQVEQGYQNAPSTSMQWHQRTQSNPSLPPKYVQQNTQRDSSPQPIVNRYQQPTPMSQPTRQPLSSQRYSQPVPTQLPAEQATSKTSPSQASTQTPTFNDQAKNAWINNCLKAVKSKNMAAYAPAFCDCGWQKLTTSGLSPSMLTSHNPRDIQKANMVMKGISQVCLMQVMRHRR